jgi:hypothetical protein
MLRYFVLLLLLANGLYFAWSSAYLKPIGWAPAAQSEPQRVQAQIKPEAIRLLSLSEAKRLETLAAASVPKPPECLQTALLNDTQASSLRSLAAQLPNADWSLRRVAEPARWIIYMGKYPNTQALARKKTELRSLGLSYENLKNPMLEPGFSIGAYSSQTQANQALAGLAKRGVRTARVVQELPERSGQIFKLTSVDDALRPKLEALKAGIGAMAWVSCKS